MVLVAKREPSGAVGKPKGAGQGRRQELKRAGFKNEYGVLVTRDHIFSQQNLSRLFASNTVIKLIWPRLIRCGEDGEGRFSKTKSPGFQGSLSISEATVGLEPTMRVLQHLMRFSRTLIRLFANRG